MVIGLNPYEVTVSLLSTGLAKGELNLQSTKERRPRL